MIPIQFVDTLDEPWQTGTCPYCGRLYKVVAPQTYECPCGQFSVGWSGELPPSAEPPPG